jgi:hypothetical protein
MGRYKQSKWHHEHEFLATLPMMLARYWELDHTYEINTAIETIDPDTLLYWTEGSLAFGQVAEYLIFNKLTAVQDILQELDTSNFGKDLKNRAGNSIAPLGMGSSRGERRALKHKLLIANWWPQIADELEDMIAEYISTNKGLSAKVTGLRKQANRIKAVIGVHES